MNIAAKNIFFILIFALFAAPARAGDADATFNAAMRLFFVGDSWTAKDLLNQNIADHPEHSLSYSGLGFIHMMGNIDPLYDGSPEVALDYIEQARALGPDNAWNHLTPAMYAAARYMQGDLAAVLDIEKHALAARRVQPDAGEPYLVLWVFYKFIKADHAKADKAYTAMLKYGMQFTNAHYMMHYAESFFGTCDAAVAEAVRGVAESPADSQWYIYWEKPPTGDSAAAARADCLFWKALLLDMRGGDPVKKERYFREALEYVPAFYEAAAGLTGLLHSQNRDDEAAQLLQVNYEKDPAPGAAFALARFHADIRPNKELLSDVLLNFPEIPPGPYAWVYCGRLAGLYEKINDADKAAQFKQRALIEFDQRSSCISCPK